MGRRKETTPSISAFKKMEKYIPDIRRFAYKYCYGTHLSAEDVIQETLISYWRFSSYAEDVKNIKRWMVEVFKNTFRNEIKKKQPPLVDYSHAYNMESSIEFFGEITKEEMNDMESKMIFGFDDYTLKLLSVLDSRDKILMILFYVHKFKHEEIGDFFGITESAVGTRLYLSKKKIRQWVKKN